MSDFIPGTEVTKHKSSHIAVKILAGFAIAACIVVLALVVLTAVFRSIDSSLQREYSVSLSEQTVMASFKEANMTAPDLSGYAYVDTANLIGPRFEDTTIGDAVADEQGKPRREVKTTASYRNNAISVIVPITQDFTYQSSSNTWVGGDIMQGDPRVTPLSALNTSAVEADLPALLEAYDAELASQFADCSAVLTPALDASGGVITAKLSKTNGQDMITCSVDLKVTWANTEGWQVFVSSASTVEHKEADDKKSSSSEGDEESKNSEPVELSCNESDTVQLSGTIETDGVRTLLRTDAPVTVTMGSGSWTINALELTTRDPSLSAELGAHVTATGSLSATGSGADAPLMITVTAVS